MTTYNYNQVRQLGYTVRTEEGNLVNPTTGNTAYVHYYSCGQCDYCQAEEYNCGQCGYCYEDYIVEEGDVYCL